jgi:hypothetical protein
VHDIVAEIGDLLRDRQLRLAPAQRFLALRRTVMSRMKPTKRGGSVPCTRPTASSAENSLPSRRLAISSRPMPMMRGSPASM